MSLLAPRPFAAALALLLACLALPGAAARLAPARRSLLDASAPVWQNYTSMQAFYQGPTLVQATTAPTGQSCAEACNDEPACLWWSWCPLLEGCTMMSFCDSTGNATEMLLPGSTCLLSGDASASQGRLAWSVIQGPAVTWQVLWGVDQNKSYRGPVTAGSLLARNEEECVAACGADAACEQWALCTAVGG
ncbi:Delta(14)-sterol reductase [Micractinium conductrix]|uniref:Delta(14)-sterol reductase n=1 Tax=Micractinium conductrix TaxID=554055 RepID=A0A2P6VLZ9_9CHLO|nr:Delta(14)-sterol reductase [Micractinium conductrix]|eukprot:PSC75109.1 Delta(14)-sterol reductase [Micractinium conductrix]